MNFDISLENGVLDVGGIPASKMTGQVRCAEFEVEIPGQIKRRYSGALALWPSGEKSEIVIVITLPLEELVAAGVYSEFGEKAPLEAKRSLAVAVRSFLLASKGRHGNEGYDVCDTTHCLVFRGLEGGQGLDETRRGLKAVEGAIIFYDGKPVQAFFHATCGGMTRAPEEVWGRSVGYPYRRIACPYCGNSLHYRWSSEIGKADLARALSIPEGAAWQLKTTGEGSVSLNVSGSTKVLLSEEFRIMVGRELGWNLLYSPWFSVRATGGGYYFEGRGFGHGVGLCEGGAVEMAHRGNHWPAIIRFYFPDARIERPGEASH